jgi:carotene biosynthesis associated membrane protein
MHGGSDVQNLCLIRTFVPYIDNPASVMDYPERMTVHVPAQQHRLEGKLELAVWVLFAVHLLAQPIYSLLPKDLEMTGTLFIVMTSTAFAFLHLFVSRGPRAAASMLVLCFLIAGSLEMLSVHTGFPYGWYAYSEKLGPGLAGVPLLVPLCWQMMAWNAASVARLITSKRWFLPVAALALTAWDVFLDPQMVRAGLWTWARNGEYVGIPLENYAGWLLTALILFAAFSRLNGEHAQENSHLTWFSVLPVLSYCWTWFGSSIVNLFWWGQPVVAVAGFIAMGVFAVPALKIVLKSNLISRFHDRSSMIEVP